MISLPPWSTNTTVNLVKLNLSVCGNIPNLFISILNPPTYKSVDGMWYLGLHTLWIVFEDIPPAHMHKHWMNMVPLASFFINWCQTYAMSWLWINTWWHHQMENFSALLALCAGNSLVTGEFPAQRPVTWSLDVFFDLQLNKRISKQLWGWWFETPSHSSWRHCNDLNILQN